MSDTLNQTHIKFSQLVQDETLLKPRLDDDVLMRDAATVQAAYRDSILQLHEDVTAALKHVKDPLEDGELAGLIGQDSGEEFDIDEVVATITQHETANSNASKRRMYQDYLIKVVDEEDVPDPHFVAFAEKKTFYGMVSSAGTQPDDLSYKELQARMHELNEQIEEARDQGDEEQVTELSRLFANLQANFRAGEPSPRTTSHAPKWKPEKGKPDPAEVELGDNQ